MHKFLVLLVVLVTTAGVWAPAKKISAQELNCETPESFQPFELDMEELDGMAPVPPTYKNFLTQHSLEAVDVQDFTPAPAEWEPALYVVELAESLQGNFCLKLQEGFVYTAALSDGRVEVLWGSDPAVSEVEILWGFSARYIPAYFQKVYGFGGWLDPENPDELLVREWRFGRYLRNLEQSKNRNDVPYFGRIGPYYTGIGNSSSNWTPPSLTATEPEDFRDAAALFGGLARADEWPSGNGVWHWEYRNKVDGASDYCPPAESCWQTTYLPDNFDGYIELWDGNAGGPRKFYVDEREILNSGAWNVDEFSVHLE